MPARRAMERVLQCVAFRGASSSVKATRRSTAASLMVRGAPERGPSISPSNRCSAKRRRHVATVGRLRPRVLATPRFGAPGSAPPVRRPRFGAGQDNSDALSLSLTHSTPAEQAPQFGPLGLRQVQRRSLWSSGHGAPTHLGASPSHHSPKTASKLLTQRTSTTLALYTHSGNF